MRTCIRASMMAALLSFSLAGAACASSTYTETRTWTVEDEPYPTSGYMAVAPEPVVVAPVVPAAPPAVVVQPAPAPYRYYWAAPSY